MHGPAQALEEEKIDIVEEFDDEAGTYKDSVFDDEATSPPRDMFTIYCATPYEIIFELCSYAYDPVLKHLSKETKKEIFKDDATEGMLIDKDVMISNTLSDTIVIFSLNTALSKVIEENVRTLTNQVKDLKEQFIQLERENNQLKEQLEISKPMKTTLDDFKKCALDHSRRIA